MRDKYANTRRNVFTMPYENTMREPAYKELMEACRTSQKVVEDKDENSTHIHKKGGTCQKGTNSCVVNN